MKKYRYWLIASILLITFIIWTILVKTVDVHFINDVGPLGFYTWNNNVNGFIQQQNTKAFDKMSDLLLYLSYLSIAPFAITGLVQWIKRKSLAKVDTIIYLLLACYIITVVIYGVFEIARVNYSPLSTKGNLKVSYPSSHVFTGASYLGIGLIASFYYFKNKFVKGALIAFVLAYIACLLVSRTLSGNHYITDIIGGGLLTLFIWSLFALLKDCFKTKGLKYTGK